MPLHPAHGQPAPQAGAACPQGAGWPEDHPACLQAQSSTNTSEKENKTQGGGFLVSPTPHV